ncbi:YDG domain-containing protein [Amphibiibacter pelophylacis]|uniref:YDG domain-containing protein n=1 Tax=Amphibiibacter pelophylacis TaxID=1799477 RepID=A0ACC6NZ12_9BURK
MNQSYRTVWNESTQSWTAVQECAKGRGKSRSSRNLNLRNLIIGSLLIPAAGFAQTALPNSPAPTQLPTGGQVSAGQASIAQQGAVMTIDQASQRAVIDWKGFDVGRDATVNFQHPSASAVTLNRVQGVDPSQIYGQIKANGQVYLSNPAGVYFSPTASVNVGGIVATTRTADSDAFMAGKDPFAGRADGANGGAVVNEGQIAAPAGSITLQGDSVVNTGTLNASSLVNKGGKIVLEAQAIALKAGSQIKADGATGGGTVHVGGGWQGAGEMRQASSVNMETGSSITANATQNGDGGEVVLWSDIHKAGGKTTAQGQVSVTGGAESGDGGRVETSGHSVDIAGFGVNALAEKGKAGQWLIDPYNYTIGDDQAAAIGDALNTADVTVTTALSNTTQGGSTNSGDAGDITVSSAITKTGSAATTLNLVADRDIAINADISSSNGALGVTAQAARNISQATSKQLTTRGGAVTYAATGNITLEALSGIDTRQADGTGGANVILGGGKDGSTAAYGYTWGVKLDSATLQAGSGAVSLRGRSNGPSGPGVDLAGASRIVAGGGIALTGESSNTNGAGVEINSTDGGNTLSLEATGGGGVSINGQTEADNSAGVRIAGDGTVRIASGTGDIRIAGEATVAGLGTSSGIKAASGGPLRVTSSGGGAITLSAKSRDSQYSKDLNIERTATTLGGAGYSGTLTLEADRPYLATGARLQGTGELVLQQASASRAWKIGSLNPQEGAPLEASNEGFLKITSVVQPGFAQVTVGRSDSTATLVSDATLTPLTDLHLRSGSGGITLRDAINADNNDVPYTVRLTTPGTVSQFGSGIHARALVLDGGGQFNMANVGNKVGTLSAPSVASLKYLDSNVLAVGDISASGPVDIATHTGDLTLSGVISTTDASDRALTLTAHNFFGAGTASGGNIVVNGGSLSVGAGGSARLYTGSIAGSTSAAALATPGQFRYASDNNYFAEKVKTGYTAPLASGTTLIYREQPTATWAVSDASITYGDNFSPAASAWSGTVNGDSSSQAAQVSAPGPLSGSGHLVAGTHALEAQGGGADLAALGYRLAYGTGTLTVAPKALVLSGITARDKIYDGSTAAPITLADASLDGRVAGDDLSVTGTFASKNVSADAQTVSLSASGADAGNYTVTGQETASARITPKAVTVSGITAADKVYDGTVSATVDATRAVFEGMIAGDDLAASSTGTFGDRNAGSGKTVTLASTYTGADQGNYTYTDQASTTASITPKAVAVSGITAGDKVYDGSRAATVDASKAVFDGLIAGDAVAASSTGQFSDKNVGSGKTVTLASTYSGADVGNYTLTDQASTTASITPKAIAVSGITAGDKVYDGSRAATVDASKAVFDGLIAGDKVAASSTGQFSDKNVGSGKTVSLTSTYSGADVGNYTLTDQASATASITPKAVAVSGITAADRVYDGTVSATVDASRAMFEGMIAGDDLAASSTGIFSDKNVGSAKTVSLSSNYTGFDVGNYTVTDQASASASITPKALAVSGITAADKVYDGATSSVVDVSKAVIDGLVAGDTVAVSATGQFSDKNVGSGKTVALASSYSGADAGNYAIADQASATASITPKALVISGVTARDKVYDGGTAAQIALADSSLDGQVAGDDLSVTGTFASKNASAEAQTVSLAVAGADVGNYSVSGQDTARARITPKTVAVSGITAADKVYDGTVSATVDASGAMFEGMIAGDDLAASSTGQFSDKNVGSGKTVSLSSNYSGADVGNYAITDQASASASITPKALAVSGITAADKVYDGATSSGVDASKAVFDGLVAGDTVAVSATGQFSDKNVGSGKTVALASSYSGADAGNYAIADQASATASITPKALSVSGITVADKVYDGATSSAVDSSKALFEGLVAGDSVAATSSGQFSDKNVGSGKTVSLTSRYSGADASNYAITDQASSTASITPKALSVRGITAADKVYDGGTAATVDARSAVFDGLVTGDDVRASATGQFADKNVGSGKNVVLTSDFTGADVGNYAITGQAAASSSISRLAQATWVGGASGSWFDAANWAGGAVPDLANVSRVDIPVGVTVDFAPPASAGAVQVDGISAGGLALRGGALDVGADGLQLATLDQSGDSRLQVAGASRLGDYTVDGGQARFGQTLVADSLTQSAGDVRVDALAQITRLARTGGVFVSQAPQADPGLVTAVASGSSGTAVSSGAAEGPGAVAGPMATASPAPTLISSTDAALDLSGSESAAPQAAPTPAPAATSTPAAEVAWTPASAGATAQVRVQIQPQALSGGEGFGFAVPAQVWGGAAPGDLQAVMPGGAALPEGVSFDSQTQSFQVSPQAKVSWPLTLVLKSGSGQEVRVEINSADQAR